MNLPGPSVHEATTVDAESLAGVLSELAEIASETLDLPIIFERVATTLRRIIPFDNMGLVRIIDGERAVVHASTMADSERLKGPDPLPLTAWSPRIRPRLGSSPRIEDARVELDPAFPIDAKALEGGVRSAMWEPFRSTDSLRGGVWLAAQRPHAFTDAHQAALRPVAALLGSALEHWRIWDTERRRRERLERVESMLGSLAESLDVREVFQRLSAEVQTLLPHHLMNMTELDLRACTIRIVASAGDVVVRTDTFHLSVEEVENRRDFAIVHDIPAELPFDSERNRLIIGSGLRSWLHVPVWLSGEVKGSLSFLHREPCRYTRDDAEVALLVAARVALTLSHQRLAEEARVAAATRQRAERLEARVETLVRELEARDRRRVTGVSRAWTDALRQAERVASAETTVLITGESGTGKEVISHLIHQGSARAGKPLVAINCAALPEQLLESELFGHERGAFTGAIATKIGRIEQADGGTLFLDEVAEMSPQVQAKLLRVLETREFQRLGGMRPVRVDVRVVAATNRDLAAAIQRQTFRDDLYYRLNVFQIHIAPLRERPEDILPLAEMFLEDLGRTMARPAAGISQDARAWFLAYPWPGNVRELRNAVERAILLCDGGLITRDHLPTPRDGPARANAAPAADGPGGAEGEPAEGGMELDAMERRAIEQALSRAQGNKSRAARLLGLTRAQLYTRLDKHRIG